MAVSVIFGRVACELTNPLSGSPQARSVSLDPLTQLSEGDTTPALLEHPDHSVGKQRCDHGPPPDITYPIHGFGTQGNTSDAQISLS